METGKKYGRFDMERLGLFSEMPYLIGYRWTPSLAVTPVRDLKGRQMFAGFTKWKSTGLQDGYFDEQFKRIFEKEGYTFMAKVDAQERLKLKRKNIVAQPFIPASSTKRQACPGDYYGTFSGIIQAFSPKEKPKGKFVKEPRGLFTNPGKKGGPGFVDIAINDFPKYWPSKYEERNIKTEKQKQKLQPFIVGSPGNFFDDNPFKSDKGITSIYRKENEAKWVLYNTFVPSGSGKKLGGCMEGCFDKWPYHSNEKYVDQYKIGKPSKDERRKENELMKGGPFYPQYRNRSLPTISIMQKKAKISVNAKNWKIAKPVTYTKEFLS